jgi:hypothetical protein
MLLYLLWVLKKVTRPNPVLLLVSVIAHNVTLCAAGYYQNEKVFEEPEASETDAMLNARGGPSVANPVYFDQAEDADDVWESADKLAPNSRTHQLPRTTRAQGPPNGVLPHPNGGVHFSYAPPPTNVKPPRPLENGHNYYNDFSQPPPSGQIRMKVRDQLPSESQV